MTLGEAIDACLAQGGFDSTSSNTSRAIVASWINRKHREMVRKSKIRRGSVELGPTTTAASYPVPDNVVEIDSLTVGTMPYNRKGRRQLARLTGGQDRIVYGVVQGFFIPTYDAASLEYVTLYPTPSAAGASITADAALKADTLTDETSDSLIVDDEFAEAVVDGAIGMGRKRVDLRPDLAADYEQDFQAKVEELRRSVNSRVGGTSSFQLRPVG